MKLGKDIFRAAIAAAILLCAAQHAGAVTLNAVLDQVSYRTEPGGQGPFHYARFEASVTPMLSGTWGSDDVNLFSLNLSAPNGTAFFLEIPEGTVVRVGANLVVTPVGGFGGPLLGNFPTQQPEFENFESTGLNFTTSGSITNGPLVSTGTGGVFVENLLNIAGDATGAGLSLTGLHLDRFFGNWPIAGGLAVDGLEHTVYLEFFVQLSGDSPDPGTDWAGFAPVPVPAALVLMLGALAALGRFRRA